MGFSLEMFFRDLESLLMERMSNAKKLRLLAKLISEARAYAKECGQIKE